MIPVELKEKLKAEAAGAEHPRERAIDIMYELQSHYGYMSDQAMDTAAEILGMSLLELEELATFYDFILRRPVGKYVIRICDSTPCWMEEHQALIDHIGRRLNIRLGETSADGLFTLLPTCCLGFCDHAPAIMINYQVYGKMTPQKVDEILERLRRGNDLSPSPV